MLTFLLEGGKLFLSLQADGGAYEWFQDSSPA